MKIKYKKRNGYQKTKVIKGIQTFGSSRNKGKRDHPRNKMWVFGKENLLNQGKPSLKEIEQNEKEYSF